MSDKPNGGSAFPESYVGADSPHEGIGDGMTLRDYFAAQALAGIMNGGTKGDPIDSLAALAYKLADAMLTERAK